MIRQFAERFSIDVPEIVDDAAAFDVDGSSGIFSCRARSFSSALFSIRET